MRPGWWSNSRPWRMPSESDGSVITMRVWRFVFFVILPPLFSLIEKVGALRPQFRERMNRSKELGKWRFKTLIVIDHPGCRGEAGKNFKGGITTLKILQTGNSSARQSKYHTTKNFEIGATLRPWEGGAPAIMWDHRTARCRRAASVKNSTQK